MRAGAPRPRVDENGTVRHRRHYTLEEARAQLPGVAERAAAMGDGHERLTDAEARHALAAGSQGNGGGSLGRQVGEAFLALQAGAAEIEARGNVSRDLEHGLIDFPAIRDDREIYLCWSDVEADIGFWHELDAGYACRRPL